jgi:hypothetical protein
VQKVSRAVEAKALVFDGHRMAPRHTELLERAVLDAAPLEGERGTEPGEARAEDGYGDA